jgi:hypothetical protein
MPAAVDRPAPVRAMTEPARRIISAQRAGSMDWVCCIGMASDAGGILLPSITKTCIQLPNLCLTQRRDDATKTSFSFSGINRCGVA